MAFVSMSEDDDDALWRSVTDNPTPALTTADSFETMVHTSDLAPYPDYCHATAVRTETHHDFGGHARHVSE